MQQNAFDQRTGLTRRVALSGLLAVCSTPLIGAAPRLPSGAANWLRAHANPVRSIDFDDEDFSDLLPLAAAIGDATVVQLGEPSHGAGSSFAAKARLVKFLHRHMGFDVLVWESGLYDMALAQSGMRGADDAVTAARRGIFALWTEALQVRPLFEYVKASQGTLRPIELAGFDMQVTANGSVAHHGAALRTLCERIHDPRLRTEAIALAVAATDARRTFFIAGPAVAQADFDALAAPARQLGRLVATHRRALDRAWGTWHTQFIERSLVNLLADAVQRLEAARSPSTTPERESRRDAVNAENLLWLVERRHAGRKVIVWAHNVHVMNAYYSPDFTRLQMEGRRRHMKPTGVFLAQQLKHRLYTIGMTAFQGMDGMATGGSPIPIAPAPEGGLEHALHALGHPYVFVDLRTSRSSGNPLRKRVLARMPKYDSFQVEDPGQVFDGLFFIDRMDAAQRA